MISDKKFISVSDYARLKGISKQAVYKQLNNKLKPFLIVVENKKCLKIEVLNEVEQQKLNQVEQPVEQQLNNQIQPLLVAQIEEKDRIIESLLRQVESLQEQNGKLTDLLNNSQLLLAAEKQQQLIEKQSPENDDLPKAKKSIFSLFSRKQK